MTDPITDRLIDLQLERHAWLTRAAEQVRQWKAEDAANGMPWGETDQSKGRECELNKPLPSNS